MTALAAIFLRMLFVGWYQGLARLTGRGGGRNLVLCLALVILAVWLSRGGEMFASAILAFWTTRAAPTPTPWPMCRAAQRWPHPGLPAFRACR